MLSFASKRIARAGLQRVGLMRVRQMAAAAAEPASVLSMEMSKDHPGVMVITFDDKEAPVNTLSQKAMDAFETVIQALEKKQGPNGEAVKAAVLRSGKPGCFIAGADITMLDKCANAQEYEKISRDGQKMMDRLEGCGVPVVSAIDGSCLGGGLEVALASTWRIASSSPKTSLGLPEVMLGLLPGAGGTQRMPKLIGLQNAIQLQTTGRNLDANRAKRQGVVDQVADPNALLPAALDAAQQLADGQLRRKPRKPTLMQYALEENPVGRNVLFNKAEQMVTKASGGVFPAPYEILKAIRASKENPGQGYETEAAGFGRLGASPESAALRGVFFASTMSKKNPYKSDLPKSTGDAPVAVLGAGLMGGGIAEVTAAKAKRRVVLRDLKAAGVEASQASIAAGLDKRVKRRRMLQADRDAIMSRVIGLHDESEGLKAAWGRWLPQCDTVIEAVFENLDLKHTIVRQLEESGLRDDAVLATNTSALPISEIAKASKHPERVVGMHYFSPVPKMPLLEIIPHEGTSKETLARAFELGLKQGKHLMEVKDVPGFYVNRCLGPYMAEVMHLTQGGAPLELVDSACKKWGWPMGPLTLADNVGIDVAAHVNEYLQPRLDNRMEGADISAMQAFLDAGLLGKKSGEGFYVHPKGGRRTLSSKAKAIVDKHRNPATDYTQITAEEVVERTSVRFLNEALLCLQDEIIKDPISGDLGAVFGIGFPPFRGGPFHYIDSLGAQQVCDTAQKWADKTGMGCYAPPQILVDYAKSGKKFRASGDA